MAEEKSQSVFASIVILLIGIWVALSPIWLSVSGGATASLIATGAVMAVAAFVQLFWEITLPSWINALAAIWLFISAFAFSMGSGAMWSSILSAIAVFILAYWDGFEVAQLHQHKMHRV